MTNVEAPPVSFAQSDELPMLRFLTCGSVDDGKSTLIGRLLYDARLIADDTLLLMQQDSKVTGASGDAIDFALLLDGLHAERQQGITIDVAYRYFATNRRKFIVADTPGHEQYTRNMATGASRCSLAVLLVDARKGLTQQTRRHTYIANMLGIRHLVLAVNKMDLVNCAEERFLEIAADHAKFLDALAPSHVVAIPVCARDGDNIAIRSTRMPWYGGPTLLAHLESIDTAAKEEGVTPFRMPVQWICRPNPDFRGYAGTIAEGSVAPGDTVRILPSRREARIARIVTADAELSRASKGDAVIVTFNSEVDVARGDVVCANDHEPEWVDQFTAQIIWFGERPMLKGRPYHLKLATQSAIAQISDIKHLIGINTLEHLAGHALRLNDIGVCNISLDRPIVIEPYVVNHDLGGFILIDRTSNDTVAAGMVSHGLRRAHNIRWQDLAVTKERRSVINGHKGCCLWFTGLSGAGKSTIANELEKQLCDRGVHTYILDGDNVRHGLNRDLGFTDADRVENIRRVAEVAHLMVDAGLVTIVSFISPFRAEREFARELFEEGEFLEIFVDTPLEICEARDPKGLYRKARAGQLANFTGIDSDYEPSSNPEHRLSTDAAAPDELARRILADLIQRQLIP